MITIGNAQAFWGDSPGAPAGLVQQFPSLQWLTLDYLAEVSLSIMAIQRDKDPSLGYARDFLQVVRGLVPHWKKGGKTKIVCNAGGLNPKGCAQAVRQILEQEGCPLRVGVVEGDDVLPQLIAHPHDPLYHNLEEGTPLSQVGDRLVTANAYLGAAPIVEQLKAGADIVVTGRVADPSLTVAPCVYEFGWSWQDYDRLAGATVAGHLIECGTQVTGGIANHWMELPGAEAIGFPVLEVEEDGSCVVTKPPGTGGRVDLFTVREQLLYEIGDPGHYLSPDVTVSFLTLQVEQVEKDRVRVSGASGSPPTDYFKVSATYRDGFRSEGMLTVVGFDAEAKARRMGEVLLQRMALAGFPLERTLVECLGTGDVTGGIMPKSSPATEVVLRVAVADSRRESVEAFTQEIAPMVTSGAPGTTGYASGRPRVRPVFGYWPCLIAKSQVKS